MIEKVQIEKFFEKHSTRSFYGRVGLKPIR